MVTGQNIFPLVEALIFSYVKNILRVLNKLIYRNHLKSCSIVKKQYATTGINPSSSK